MIDGDNHHYASWLRSTATDLDHLLKDLPRSFDSAYGNGREVVVCDLVEAAERVARHHRGALNEASFHSQGRRASAGSAFLLRTLASSASTLAQVSLDLTRAVEAKAHLADTRVRAPSAARALERRTASEIDPLLLSVRADIARAAETMRSGADSLTNGHPLPAPGPAEGLATAARLRQGPTPERQAAVLARSATEPATAAVPPQTAPATPGTAALPTRGPR